MHARDQQLRRGIRPDLPGVEIGALNNPIIRTEEGPIEFVDYGSTEVLKEQHKLMPDRAAGIVNVHHVWTGTGSLAEVVGGPNRYHHAIASHVIEHVPNVLGWFKGIYEVLKPNGVFNLAIPDRRYTFDVNRNESTLGELVEADMLGYTKPSIRQMFDHCMLASAIEPGAVWRENIDTASLPPFCGDVALQLAYDQAIQIVRDGRYVDSHCWIFTPLSFLNLLEGATKLRLFPFLIKDISLTEPGTFEFYVHLMKSENMTSDEICENQSADLQSIRRKLEQARAIARLSAL